MSLNLKFVRGTEIRKAHLIPQTIAELSACIESIFGSTDFHITYLDVEGDRVTILTQLDLESAYNAAVAENRFGLKMFLEPKPAEVDYITQSAHVVESEEDEPEVKEAEVLVFEAVSEAVEEPVTEIIVEEPVAEIIVEEPVAEIIVEEPVAEIIVEEPVAEVIVEEPVIEIIVEQTVPEVEQPKAQEEEKEVPTIRKCGLKKAMKAAAKQFKDAFKPMCKKFKGLKGLKGFKGCKAREVPLSTPVVAPEVHIAAPEVPVVAPEAPVAQLFTEEQIAFLRNLIREETGQIKPVHSRFTCDGCGAHPIVGVRYNCTVCRNFDFCETCEANTEHNHPFIKHKTVEERRPRHRANEVVVELDLGNVLPFVPEQLKEVVEEVQSKLSERLARNAEGEGQESHRGHKWHHGHRGHRGLRKAKGLKGKALEHLTLPKFTEVLSETEYNKVWVLANKGELAWPVGSKLVQIRGKLQTLNEVELPPLAPGETAEVSVIVKTPSKAGKAKGVWIMQTPEGQHFGRVKCIVMVAAPASTEVTEATEAKSEEQVVLENVLPQEHQVESIFVQAVADRVESIFVQAEEKPVYSEDMQKLINMGFSPESAAIALETAKSDFNLAISMLLAQ